MTWMLVISLWASSASAQREHRELAHRERLMAEQLMLDDESREVTGLYVAGACLFTTGAALAVLGGLTFGAGDTVGPGLVILPFAPLPTAIGIAVLAIAAGYDAGLAPWRTAASDGTGPVVAPARAELSSRIAWTYGIGAGIFVLSMASIVVMYAIDRRIQAGPYMVPVGVSVIGIATMLAGAGMDIAAGAWSPFVPSVSPLPEGGVMATGTGWL
jgi:hypothetical protein